MKTRSAKAKGRRLQQFVVTLLQSMTGFGSSDIKSTPMGTNGPDLWLSSEAKNKIPLTFECKNTEKLNIWKAIAQAEENREPNTDACVVFSRNHSDVYVAIPITLLVRLLHERK